MLTIIGRNVNEIFPIGILFLKEEGVERPSRNGPTIEISEPVSVCYLNPSENVLFDKVREINPFLTFFEPLWILAGRDDVAFMRCILGSFAKYSDDGIIYHGAYGRRMRHPFNQIEEAIHRLKDKPDDRRVVLQIRHKADIYYGGADSPCNICAALRINDGALDIHVFNRSNDFIWGLAGTNAVQFSVLQEYIAGHIGCRVGKYHQTTNCMHVYTGEQWDKVKDTSLVVYDPYKEGDVSHYPMMEDPEGFEWDLAKFFGEFDLEQSIQDSSCYCTKYFQEVVVPMWNTFLYHKGERRGLEIVQEIQATDWKLVTSNWLEKRKR